MAKFRIKAVAASGTVRYLLYDNQSSQLLWEDGQEVVKVSPKTFTTAEIVSKDKPGRKSAIQVLKISLGLSCNYGCSYCSQRFVPHAQHTNIHDIDRFAQQLDAALVDPPLRIEFWGGEPLVYIKTLKPLAERLKVMYPTAEFHLITNGSLLNTEINLWLEQMNFGVAISHDGPGQHVRGPDPLSNEHQHAAIMDLYARLHPKNQISINSMISRHNPSRGAVQKWFIEQFGDNVNIGEGAFIDPYDEGSMNALFQNNDEHFQFRRQAFGELRLGAASQFDLANSKTMDFVNSIQYARPASSLGQKCGMDRSDQLAVDMMGNVLTCQNTSAVSLAPNGHSHNIGSLTDLQLVRMRSATHWSERLDCAQCPVVQLCKGSCMFLKDQMWDAACEASYSDNIVFFAFAITLLTGCIPVYIEGNLAEHRKDIFGLENDVKEASNKKYRTFPIQPI